MSKIRQGQNILDKCLELTGDLSGLLDMVIVNGISVTDDLPIGFDVKPVAVSRAAVVRFFTENDPPATRLRHWDNSDITDMFGIGDMTIENTFIVR